MPPLPQLKPYWETTNRTTARLYLGDVRKVLRRLPSSSVHCVVTSPPYWGLRDYGVEGQIGSEPSPDCETKGQAQCGRCFVCTMVEVFREVRRVLRDDGTLWLNLGDTYSGGAGGRGDSGNAIPRSDGTVGRTADKHNGQRIPRETNVPSGNLVGVPWRVALALQADGWILRSDVIWHKPAPMPESVRNRCTKAHEYVFQFAKKMGYYFDQEAIKESQSLGTIARFGVNSTERINPGTRVPDRRDQRDGGGEHNLGAPGGMSNKRTVWSIDDEAALRLWLAENAPETLERFLDEAGYKGDVWRITHSGYKGAHFAVFPQRLVEPCILATTSAEGCCSVCSAPLKRIVEGERKATRNVVNPKSLQAAKRTFVDPGRHVTETKTLGWEPTCECYCGIVGPCTVLDPFAGSGTTIEVAINHKRRGIGIELSEKYMTTNLMPRVVSCLLSRISTRGLVPMKPTERVELPGEHFS